MTRIKFIQRFVQSKNVQGLNKMKNKKMIMSTGYEYEIKKQ